MGIHKKPLDSPTELKPGQKIVLNSEYLALLFFINSEIDVTSIHEGGSLK